MLLRQKQEISPGVLAKVVRDQLRKAASHGDFHSRALDRKTLRLLEDKGYIKHVGDQRFELTRSGAVFCDARVGQPFPRVKAHALLQEVLARAKKINETPGLIDIDQILVFDGYLNDALTKLEYLELAIATRSRPGADANVLLLLSERKKVIAKLRNGSHYLRFSDASTIEANLTHRQVFPTDGPITVVTGPSS